MSNIKKFFWEMKHGIFVHFVHTLSPFSDGHIATDVDETVNSFDVEGFADTIKSSGAEYLVLTAWHYNMIPIYPSKVTEKWRGLKTPKRDLLGEIIDAVNARGIAMILYTHPRDGHDFDEESRKLTGWGQGYETHPDVPNFEEFDYKRWNAYVKELYTELADRYASRLIGFYTDGVGPYRGKGPNPETYKQVVDYLMIRDIMKSRNPDIAMIQNFFGHLYSDDYAMPEGYFGYEGIMNFKNTEKWPVAEKSLAFCPFDGAWWGKLDADKARIMPVEDIVKYTLFNCSVTVGGGLCWACGPFAEGNIWPWSVTDVLKSVGNEINRYKETALNAVSSKSYPTVSGDTLEKRNFTFFMSSKDKKFEYMHIMPPRNDKKIHIPFAEDSAELNSPVSLTDSLNVVSFNKTDDGYELCLEGSFDKTDSVIRFERINAESTQNYHWINDTDKRIRYDSSWIYHHLVGTKGDEGLFAHGCFENDFHRAEKKGSSLFFAFEGSFVEIYGNKRPENGNASVYIDGIKVGVINEFAESASVREVMYRSINMHGGWHTLNIVLDEDKPFDVDAIKIYE